MFSPFWSNCRRVEPQDEGFNWSSDILEAQRSNWFEWKIEATMHVVSHRTRHTDTADGTRRLQPSSNVDAITM
jgi:hypothetical protein